MAMYAPRMFPLLAILLAEIESRGGPTIPFMFSQIQFSCTCPATPLPPGGKDEARTAVLCSDADELHQSVADVQAHFEEAAKRSVFADVVMGNAGMVCTGWTIRPKERFKGKNLYSL